MQAACLWMPPSPRGKYRGDGGILFLATMKCLFPSLGKLFAEANFAGGIAKILPRLKTSSDPIRPKGS
jgi:hypothetical protein